MGPQLKLLIASALLLQLSVSYPTSELLLSPDAEPDVLSQQQEAEEYPEAQNSKVTSSDISPAVVAKSLDRDSIIDYIFHYLAKKNPDFVASATDDDKILPQGEVQPESSQNDSSDQFTLEKSPKASTETKIVNDSVNDENLSSSDTPIPFLVVEDKEGKLSPPRQLEPKSVFSAAEHTVVNTNKDCMLAPDSCNDLSNTRDSQQALNKPLEVSPVAESAFNEESTVEFPEQISSADADQKTNTHEVIANNQELKSSPSLAVDSVYKHVFNSNAGSPEVESIQIPKTDDERENSGAEIPTLVLPNLSQNSGKLSDVKDIPASQERSSSPHLPIYILRSSSEVLPVSRSSSPQVDVSPQNLFVPAIPHNLYKLEDQHSSNSEASNFRKVENNTTNPSNISTANVVSKDEASDLLLHPLPEKNTKPTEQQVVEASFQNPQPQDVASPEETSLNKSGDMIVQTDKSSAPSTELKDNSVGVTDTHKNSEATLHAPTADLIQQDSSLPVIVTSPNEIDTKQPHYLPNTTISDLLPSIMSVLTPVITSDALVQESSNSKSTGKEETNTEATPTEQHLASKPLAAPFVPQMNPATLPEEPSRPAENTLTNAPEELLNPSPVEIAIHSSDITPSVFKTVYIPFKQANTQNELQGSATQNATEVSPPTQTVGSGPVEQIKQSNLELQKYSASAVEGSDSNAKNSESTLKNPQNQLGHSVASEYLPQANILPAQLQEVEAPETTSDVSKDVKTNGDLLSNLTAQKESAGTSSALSSNSEPIQSNILPAAPPSVPVATNPAINPLPFHGYFSHQMITPQNIFSSQTPSTSVVNEAKPEVNPVFASNLESNTVPKETISPAPETTVNHPERSSYVQMAPGQFDLSSTSESSQNTAIYPSASIIPAQAVNRIEPQTPFPQEAFLPKDSTNVNQPETISRDLFPAPSRVPAVSTLSYVQQSPGEFDLNSSPESSPKTVMYPTLVVEPRQEHVPKMFRHIMDSQNKPDTANLQNFQNPSAVPTESPVVPQEFINTPVAPIYSNPQSSIYPRESSPPFANPSSSDLNLNSRSYNLVPQNPENAPIYPQSTLTQETAVNAVPQILPVPYSNDEIARAFYKTLAEEYPRIVGQDMAPAAPFEQKFADSIAKTNEV